MGEPAMIVQTARQRLEPLGDRHLRAYVALTAQPDLTVTKDLGGGRIVDRHEISRQYWEVQRSVPR
jgi:hypothetical protein